MAYPHGDPRGLPLPALPPSPALASPPPVIVVEPFDASTPRPSQPQLSTYSPSSLPPGAAPPQYTAGQAYTRRSPAEEEKDAYFARAASFDSYGSHSHDGHWADSHVPGAAPLAVGGKAAPPPILLPPPRAAFVNEPGSPRSPMSLKQAIAFGDVGSVMDEKVGGRGAADVRKSGLDWDLFARRVKESEREKESEWLRRKKGVSKKWWVLGWCGSVCVIIAIIVALVVHFKNPTGDTMPAVSKIGGTTSKAANSGSSSSMLSSLGAPAASWASAVGATTSSPIAASSTSAALVVDNAAATSSSTTTQRAAAATTETSTRTTARTTTATAATTSSTTTSARAATDRTTASSASSSAAAAATTSASRASVVTATDATGADRHAKRWLRFGQDGRSVRADRKAWDAIEFVHPSNDDARKRHVKAREAH